MSSPNPDVCFVNYSLIYKKKRERERNKVRAFYKVSMCMQYWSPNLNPIFWVSKN